MDSTPATVLWRYNQWRCEYQADAADHGGFVVLYVRERAIFHQRASAGTDAHHRAAAFRALVQISESRRGPAEPN